MSSGTLIHLIMTIIIIISSNDTCLKWTIVNYIVKLKHPQTDQGERPPITQNTQANHSYHPPRHGTSSLPINHHSLSSSDHEQANQCGSSKHEVYLPKSPQKIKKVGSTEAWTTTPTMSWSHAYTSTRPNPLWYFIVSSEFI